MDYDFSHLGSKHKVIAFYVNSYNRFNRSYKRVQVNLNKDYSIYHFNMSAINLLDHL